MTIFREVLYTVSCDDGRFCNPRMTRIFPASNKGEAIVAARAAGWVIRGGKAVQCPSCRHQHRAPDRFVGYRAGGPNG